MTEWATKTVTPFSVAQFNLVVNALREELSSFALQVHSELNKRWTCVEAHADLYEALIGNVTNELLFYHRFPNAIGYSKGDIRKIPETIDDLKKALMRIFKSPPEDLPIREESLNLKGFMNENMEKYRKILEERGNNFINKVDGLLSSRGVIND